MAVIVKPKLSFASILLLGTLVLLGSSSLGLRPRTPRKSAAPSSSGSTSFDAFVSAHRRGYKPGSAEYARRLALFERRKAEAEEQNRKPGRLWTAQLNQFSDWTEVELRRLRGLKESDRRGARANLLGAASRNATKAVVEEGSFRDLPASKSWTHLKAIKEIKDQGACGSCWAIAAGTVMAAHAEIKGGQNSQAYSTQELVACVPNPNRCGGDGGCKGATMDLAMEYAVKRGKLSTEAAWPYDPENVAGAMCPNMMLAQNTTSNSSSAREPGIIVNPSTSSVAIGFESYRILPRNSYEPLLRSLYTTGPVGVSVAASQWFNYQSGIFDGCEGLADGAVVDHAVVLVAYGAEGGNKYWTLMNSWGATWGENGYIRLLRRDDDRKRCATNYKPELGTACVPYPDKVTVCGMCGVLYDSVVVER